MDHNQINYEIMQSYNKNTKLTTKKNKIS